MVNGRSRSSPGCPKYGGSASQSACFLRPPPGIIRPRWQAGINIFHFPAFFQYQRLRQFGQANAPNPQVIGCTTEPLPRAFTPAPDCIWAASDVANSGSAKARLLDIVGTWVFHLVAFDR
jgi:hypothetical protein